MEVFKYEKERHSEIVFINCILSFTECRLQLITISGEKN